jgi:membrane-associated protein
MDLVRKALDVFLHLDRHLNALAGDLGSWLYGLLFLIVFCETGLVVTPFLPGDSLLFAVGALATRPGSPINLPLVSLLLSVAAVLGDAVNYSAGSRLGQKVFTSEPSRLLDKEHLMRAHRFYERYGGKAIFLARFVPVIRTFAPFVAGVGRMSYARFALYNVTGGIVWINSFLLAGYFFADLPVVREQFHYIILAISVISVMPIGIEYLRARREARRSGPAAAGDPARARAGSATDSARPRRSRS